MEPIIRLFILIFNVNISKEGLPSTWHESTMSMDERKIIKKYFLKKRLFALIFLGTIFSFSITNGIENYQLIKEEIAEKLNYEEYLPSEAVSLIETTINENLLGRVNFIETYGFIQVLLNKKECNNFTYIKDEEGYLHYATFYREADTQLFDYALRVKRLQDYVEKDGTKVLFVVPPSKYDKKLTEFGTGLPVNDPNPVVDEMLFYLNRMGIESLDMREFLPSDQISYEETFFKTDHHWTIPAAFYATDAIKNKINESFGENLDPNNYYLNFDNYDQVTYYSGMLGSMGRKTGANFCGIEDFTALWPKYEGSFKRESMFENGNIVKKEGSFVEALMDTEVLTENTDLYTDSQYSLYLNGLCIYEKILNENNPDGAKIFMIRDSYFSPVISFMMPMCSEIDAIWSLEDTHQLDVEKSVVENKYDYIIIEVYPYNINNNAFNYFKEP